MFKVIMVSFKFNFSNYSLDSSDKRGVSCVESSTAFINNSFSFVKFVGEIVDIP